MKIQTALRLSLAGCVVGLLAGCASTDATSQSQVQNFFPKPSQVLVYDFAVSPDEVELNSGLGADLQNLVTTETPRTEQEKAIGRQVADALANHLVTEIQALGLPAQKASGPPPATGNILQIKGQFISIDEGNQTERVVIGLGLGRTDVRTMTQVYESQNGSETLINKFDINAESGRKPGMAETMGAGGAAGNLAVSAVVSTGAAVGSEAFSANVDADADRTAKKLPHNSRITSLNRGGFCRSETCHEI